MLSFEVDGLRCHRALVETADHATTLPLKADDYSFVVSYGGFQDREYDVQDKMSAMVDLAAGIDAAFARFSATSRNEVRGSYKLPELAVHFGFDEVPLDQQYAFHAACEHDRGWIPVPPSEFASCQVHSVTFDGELIAGVTAFGDGDRLRVARIYSSKRSARSEVLTNRVFGCAQKRLVYEICRHAVEAGARSLDLGGVDPGDPTKAGIASFKQSFGPTLEQVQVARFRSERFAQQAESIADRGWDIA